MLHRPTNSTETARCYRTDLEVNLYTACCVPGSTGRFPVRISGAYALRLISRAGKEGSTVSSIICDRWLILS